MSNLQKKIFSLFLAGLFAISCLHETGSRRVQVSGRADLEQLVSILRNIANDINSDSEQIHFKKDFKQALNAFYLAAGLKTVIKKATQLPGPGNDIPLAPKAFRLIVFMAYSDDVDSMNRVCDSLCLKIVLPPPRYS